MAVKMEIRRERDMERKEERSGIKRTK